MERLVGFVMSSDADRSRAFYVDVLGLEIVQEDNFALVLRSGENMVRVVKAPTVTPQPFTVLGWETDSIVERVRELAARGVSFTRYPWFEQDELGIWTAPGGAKVAWFSDPDGNVLSLSQH